MRREFTKAVKLAAWQRCNGQCEGCTCRLMVGRFEYHHKVECTYDGEATLENCQVLCIPCHDAITGKRAKDVAKSNRVRNKFLGIKKAKGAPMPGSKRSRWKRRMDGTVVPR